MLERCGRMSAVGAPAFGLKALLDSRVRCLPQINDIYKYQEAFGARLVLEGPYVPSFGSDIPGGPPGLGVR